MMQTLIERIIRTEYASSLIPKNRAHPETGTDTLAVSLLGRFHHLD